MNQTKQTLSQLMLIICLLTLAITLTIHSRWLYVYDLNHTNISEYVEYSSSIILKNYDELLHYFNDPWIKFLNMSDFPTSNSGAFHMFQVKILFQINYIALVLSSLYSFFYIRKLKRESQLWTLIQPLTYVLIILGIGIFFMIVGFNEFFTIFHKLLFFGNDDWIFNPVTDPIILVLPEKYFFHCFILFFSLFILFIVIFILIGKREFKRIQKPGKSTPQ